MADSTKADLNVCFPIFLNIKHVSYTVHIQTIFIIDVDGDKTDHNIPTNIRLSAHSWFHRRSREGELLAEARPREGLWALPLESGTLGL